MTTYYVHKGVGSDSNSGLSWALAWATLAKAAAASGVNDTVYVRAGATPYYERLGLSKNGQRWLADAGHTPIVDGKYHDGLTNFNLSDKPPGTYVVQKTGKLSFPSLAAITADDCVIDGFKICNSGGRGLLITGSRNAVRNCWVDWTYTSGIMVNSEVEGGPTSCVDNLIEDTEVTRCSAAVYANLDETVWGRPWDVIVAAKNCETPTFRRLRVHHNHAEGIVLGAGCTGGIVEYCRSWNNEHMCYYINNSRGSIMRFNVGFSTGNPEVLRKGLHASECLVITEEKRNARADSWARNAQVYGNIFVGGKFVVDIARMGAGQDSQLINVYIGFNTIVGLPDVTDAVLNGGTVTVHETSVFENNIIYAPAGIPIKARATDPMTGLKARGNVIYRPGGAGTIPNWLNGPGTLLADPKLANPGAVIIDNGGVRDRPPLAGDTFDANNYKIASTSPAINAAVVTYPFNGHAGAESARTRDYFGATRAVPDIGAHEFGGVVTNSVTAAFTRNPTATTLVEGATVAFTNTSYTTGTASLTGQVWRVRKAGTIVYTATTADMSYTFATDGAYTVELAVTATGGLSDSETIALTITDPAPGVVVTAAFSANPSATTIVQGTVVAFTGASTVQNGTLASEAWAILSLPGEAVVATGDGASYSYTFDTAGSFRVRLTATAATGQTDTETRDYTVTAFVPVTVDASFTSDDVDGIVTAGDSVTFTNTSTASEAISGYKWAVVTIGLSDGQLFTTPNLTYPFTTPGLYRVQLTVTTVSGASDTVDTLITVQQLATTGEDWMVAPEPFAVATATGTQTITAAALGDKTPRGVHIILIGTTADETAATGALWSEGAASESAQWVHARFSAHGEAITKAWRRRSLASVVMTLDATGAKTGEARFLRFVPGGVEIDVVDAFPAAYRAIAVFYAGDVCKFWAGSKTLGGEDVAVDVTTGFAQDAVYMLSSWAAAEDTPEADADFSRGWALRDGTQLHFRNEDRHAAETTFLVTRLQTRLGSSADGTEGYTSIEAGAFTSTGFSVTPRSSPLLRDASFFAFAAPGYAVGLEVVNLPISGGLDVPADFEPQAVMALTSTFGAVTTASGGQVGGADAEGQGFYVQSIHGPAAMSLSIASDNGVATSATRSLSSADFRAVAPDGADLWHGVGALDADGFAVATWTDQPAAPYRAIVLTVERGTNVIVEPENPVADWTATKDINPATSRAAVWFDASTSSGMGLEITAYLWDFGDGTTSTEVAPFHLYERPGEFAVSLTVTTSAGANTKTIAAYVVIPEVGQVTHPIGLSEPLTSGGATGNSVNEDGDHTHAVRFNGWAHFKALSATEVAAFLATQSDDAYALMAYDTENHRFIIREPDGAVRYIVTTT